jgi:hypothetical protein
MQVICVISLTKAKFKTFECLPKHGQYLQTASANGKTFTICPQFERQTVPTAMIASGSIAGSEKISWNNVDPDTCRST